MDQTRVDVAHGVAMMAERCESVGQVRHRKYTTYRDSGLPWVGAVPTSWTIVPVYARYEVALGKMLDAKQISGVHLKPYLRNVDVQWDKVNIEELPLMDFAPADRERFSLRPGDLLVCEGGEVGRTAMWQGELDDCYYQKALHRVRPRDTSDLPRFFYYVMWTAAKQGVFSGSANANTIDHLTAVQLRHFHFPLPGPAEQRAIADFLDRETAEIDALIAKKERLIELLQEKRTALITRAVTKGLDPSVPMKDSGVEWLGEMPAHWEVSSNRHLFREVDVRSHSGEEELLTVSHITGVTRRSEKVVTMIEAESHKGYKRCQEGDLVVNTMWAWMGALGVAKEAGIVSPAYNVYGFSRNTLLPAYLDLVCRVPAYVCDLIRHSKGVWRSRLRLYPDEFRDVVTMVPSIEEQARIVAVLEKESARIQRLGQQVQNAIDHLKEYRTALISAAVTGKIDVRGEEVA